MSDETPSVSVEKITLASQSIADPAAGLNSDPANTVTVTDQNTPIEAKPPSMKQIKNMYKQRRYLGKVIVTMRHERQKKQNRVNRQLKELEKQIGTDDFEAIKVMVTTFHPEQKDEKGNVVQQAHNAVNHKALLTEAKNFLILRRERRMKNIENPDGTVTARTRKRTSGRSSDRKAHKIAYNHIIERGKKAVENKEEVSTIKV